MGNGFYVSSVKGEEAESAFGYFVGHVLSYDYILELVAGMYADLLPHYEPQELGIGAWFEDNVGGIMFDAYGDELCWIGLVAVADDLVSSNTFDKDIWNQINEEVDG